MGQLDTLTMNYHHVMHYSYSILFFISFKVEKVVEIKKRLDSECSVVSGTSETRQKSAFFENLYSVIEQRKELKDLLLSAAAVSTEVKNKKNKY